MTNRVVLVGRLTRDIDLRNTQSGILVAQFTLAVARQFDRKQADFISCVAWRKAAETLKQYTGKGSRIAIDGHIQTRSYDDKDGKKVYVTEVVTDEFELLDSKSTSNQPEQAPLPEAPAENDPTGGIMPEISEDDLPF